MRTGFVFGVVCLVLAAAAAASAAPRRILYVGDSLGVGTTPALARELQSSARVEGDSRTSRPSSIGLQVLMQLFDPRDDVVVFDLGTNDDPARPAALASDLASARRVSGSSCMVVATLNRPPLNGYSVDGLNRAVEQFASSASNVRLVDWHAYAQSDPSLLGPDHVHPTPQGYAVRAQLFAQAIGQCGSRASPAVPPRAPRTRTRPQRPKRPAPHVARPRAKVPGIESSGISFSEPLRVRGVAAQLTLPTSRPPYPAVVLIGAPQAEAEALVKRGVAVLAYAGAHTGTGARAPRTQTAVAAAELLRRRPDIRGGAVALWAGGRDVPIAAGAAAADRRIAAVVVIGPSPLAPAELRDWRIRRALGAPAPAVTKWLRLRARGSARADPAGAWRRVRQPVFAAWPQSDRSIPAHASAVALREALAAGRGADRAFSSPRTEPQALEQATTWLDARLTAKPVPVVDTRLPPPDRTKPARIANASAIYSVPVQLAWLLLPVVLLATAVAPRMRPSRGEPAPSNAERSGGPAPLRGGRAAFPIAVAAVALVALAGLAAIAGGVAEALHADGRGVAILLGLPWPFTLAFALTGAAAIGCVWMLGGRAHLAAAGIAAWIALAVFWLL